MNTIEIISVEKFIHNIQEIQKQFKFKIPGYILHEIALEDYEKTSLNLLINCAVMNNRLTKEECRKIKEKYCFK